MMSKEQGGWWADFGSLDTVDASDCLPGTGQIYTVMLSL